MKQQVLKAIERFQLDRDVTKLVNARVKELVKDHHPQDRFGPPVTLEDSEVKDAIQQWLDYEADAEELAEFTGDRFGGKCEWKVNEQDESLFYVFYPDYNEYAGAFGVEFKTQKVTWEISYLCSNAECEMSSTPVTLDRLFTLNPEPRCHRCGSTLHVDVHSEEESHERE